MLKKLFIEMLPFNRHGSGAHQISIILEFNNEIKCAYHYKLKYEDQGVDNDLIKLQGYDLDEINSNPQWEYQVHLELTQVLEKYINKYVPKDKALIYCYGVRSYELLRKFFYDNGDSFFYSYFKSYFVDIKSLLADKLGDNNEYYKDLSLKEVSEGLLGELTDRDAMSRLVAIYKLYKSI